MNNLNSLNSLRHVTEMSLNIIDIKTLKPKDISFFRNENNLWTSHYSDVEFTDEHLIRIISGINSLNDQILNKNTGYPTSGTTSTDVITLKTWT